MLCICFVYSSGNKITTTNLVWGVDINETKAGYSKRFTYVHQSWWRHQMEKFSALLAFCSGNSPVTGEILAVTRSFDVFFDMRLNKQLSKQSWGSWFDTPSHSLWGQCNGKDSWCLKISYLLASSAHQPPYYWLWEMEIISTSALTNDG